MQVAPPDGGAVAAFSGAIEELTGGDGAPILLAVSGGPDSLALLLLAHCTMPDRIRSATVDHRLRPEAAEEALYVGRICENLGIPHATLTPDEPIVGSIQASARAMRYQLLDAHAEATGCRWIATAHHADDQLETLLMRFMRGSGIDGMSAIRARNRQVIRPLLGFVKEELENICAMAGIEPVRDPSNESLDFDRVGLRKWLAKRSHPFDPVRAARSASALADASEALDWAVERLAEEHLKLAKAAATLVPADLPRELLRRLLLRALAHIETDAEPRGDAIDRALRDLPKGKRLTLGNVLCEGGTEWHFRPAPPRRH